MAIRVLFNSSKIPIEEFIKNQHIISNNYSSNAPFLIENILTALAEHNDDDSEIKINFILNTISQELTLNSRTIIQTKEIVVCRLNRNVSTKVTG